MMFLMEKSNLACALTEDEATTKSTKATKKNTNCIFRGNSLRDEALSSRGEFPIKKDFLRVLRVLRGRFRFIDRLSTRFIRHQQPELQSPVCDCTLPPW